MTLYFYGFDTTWTALNKPISFPSILPDTSGQAVRWPLSYAAPVQCVLARWDGVQHGLESRDAQCGPGLSCPQGHGRHDSRRGETERKSEENGRMALIVTSIHHYVLFLQKLNFLSVCKNILCHFNCVHVSLQLHIKHSVTSSSKSTHSQCSAWICFFFLFFHTFVVVPNLQGVLSCKEAKYDHLQDDERQCARCRTTCYLSAITCPCSPGVQVCLHHISDLCSCPITNYTLK